MLPLHHSPKTSYSSILPYNRAQLWDFSAADSFLLLVGNAPKMSSTLSRKHLR